MERDFNTFTRMLLHVTGEKTITGHMEGNCCICGEHTTQGNPKKFGANFTCADYLEQGDVICEYCQHLVKNSNKYRRTMFLLTPKEFKPFKKQNIKEIIFDLPVEDEFYLYLTQTWQKIGYILMDKARNTPHSDTISVVMDYDVITYKPDTLREYYEIVGKLREHKISKEVITSAHFEMHHLRRLIEAYGREEAQQLLQTAEENKGNPVWELATYISD